MNQDNLAQQFQQQGYVVLPDFFDSHSMQALQQEAHRILDDFDADAQRHIFTTKDHSKTRDDYFLSSDDKVRCFFEEDAFDQSGNLSQDKHLSVNKIGHALHVLNDVFRDFSHQPAIRQVANQVGLESPVIHQSMYIFKQPNIGGEVRWHQDASYFLTQPVTVTTFWIALEDAHTGNGCLWVQPGGHQRPLKEQFIRHADDRTELLTLDDQPWPSQQESIPLEVKKGTLVVFHGLLPHYSSKNISDKSRHAYTLHMTCATSHYARENWIQSPPSHAWLP